MKSDARIDHLYQLPLTEFVSARNALAKEGGPDAGSLKALQKPSVPAWAVNQLYWKRRAAYDELTSRAEDLRATHLATLRGKKADLRGASRDHEQAVDAALRATIALLADEGQPVTDATKQAIATTLRGLPADEPPGRLTRALEPRGFEMLGAAAGASSGKIKPPAPSAKSPASQAGAVGKQDKKQEAAAKAAAREREAAAREALVAAARATRVAEQAARREEFEAARAAREADKALQRVTEAEAAVTQAKRNLEEAERAAKAAARSRDQAEERVERAQKELKDLQAREEKARAAVS